MSTTYTREQIYDGLLIEIAECLSLEPDEIKPEHSFFTDLGGESIDLLDCSFKVKNRFQIEPKFPGLLEVLEVDANGTIIQSSVARLAQMIPTIEWAKRVAAVQNSDPRDLLTVDLMAELLLHWQSEKTNGSKELQTHESNSTIHVVGSAETHASLRG
jgi:acyl carrier protein